MTPKAQEQWFELRRAQAPVERATAVLCWSHLASEIRLKRLRERNPQASDAELMALWTEETYRGTVDASFLARACDAIRTRVVDD